MTAALRDRVRDRVRAVRQEVAKFGAVGTVTLVVDVGLFTLLRSGLGDGGPLETRPLLAKTLSVSAATLVSWLGNRLWTFRRHRRAAVGRELVLFLAANAAGMAIALACLAVSHYVLDLTSARADTVSANGVGLVLGTAFRFWAYRRLVFTGRRGRPPAPTDPAPRGPELSTTTNGDRP